MGFSHLLAGGLLCGIGFTMSLFIADLSFNDYKTLENAKLAIIVASLLAGLSGALLLSGLAKK
jgi:NhaA family Na+:H+ antiporter